METAIFFTQCSFFPSFLHCKSSHLSWALAMYSKVLIPPLSLQLGGQWKCSDQTGTRGRRESKFWQVRLLGKSVHVVVGILLPAGCNMHVLAGAHTASLEDDF